MTLQPNQIETAIQTATGRPATPFELQNHANSSVSTLANLKDTHAKLDPNSIVDYLTSIGQDPSMKNRQALGVQHGITGIGTAVGNTALLNAMKSGNVPTPPTIGGTITTTPAVTTPTNVTDTTTPINTNASNQDNVPQPTPDNSQPIPSPYTPQPNQSTPPVLPEVASSQTAYTQSQQAVVDINKQILDINNTINASLQNKRDEIARSGGIVDESQLRSTVLAENAPLLAERNSLTANRSQLVGEQTIAGNAYKDAVAMQRESDANFYKTQVEADKKVSLGQGQQKIDTQASQFSTKTDIQATQFTQKEQDLANKLAQSGWKSVPVTSYDQYGDVVGKSNVWTQNPADKIGVDIKGNVVSISQDTQGNTVTKPIQTQANAPKTAQLDTGSTVNPSTPGYATATVLFGGKDSQLTQAYIDKIAITAIMNGGVVPVGTVRGTKGLPMIQSNAIKARIGQLDPSGNLALNKAEAKAWGATITKQIDYASTLNRSLKSADADFQQIIKTFKDTGVNDQSMPISNIIANFAKYNMGSGDVSAFQTSLVELSRLYSQVFSQTGRTTDATNQTAKDIISGDINIDKLTQVVGQLQALGQIDVNKAFESVKNASTSFQNIIPGSASSPTARTDMTPQGAKDFVEKSLTSQGLNYNDTISKYTPNLKQGEKLAIDNNTGDIIAVTSADDASSYTPL